MKNFINSSKQWLSQKMEAVKTGARNLAIVGAVGLASVSAMPHQANAAIAAADLTTAMTSITTDAQTVFDAVLPILISVLALVIGMKLVKRFTNKI